MASRTLARSCAGALIQRHSPTYILARDNLLVALAATTTRSFTSSGAFREPQQPMGITPSVLDWAREHNVGFARELTRLSPRVELPGLVTVKFSPRHVFRAHHVGSFFMEPQHTMMEYWLYKYGLDAEAAPLWVQLAASMSVKPVVRSCAKRRLRVALHAALQEAGWTPEGWPWEGEQGQGHERAPPVGSRRELRGTVVINVTDPIVVNKLPRDQCLDVARNIVKAVVEKQGEGVKGSDVRPRRTNRSNRQ